MSKLRLWLFAALTGCRGLVGTDLSPDEKNYVVLSGASTAGNIVHMTGSRPGVFYAVSLNAGVWRSIGGAAWQQLPQSTQFAHSIALDPNDIQHLAFGERDGDFLDPIRNQSGVRESHDFGWTFPEYFDPRSLGGCASSQAIPALTFTTKGSVLVAATACGVAVKPKQGQWSFPTTPLGAARITSVVASETKVWARDFDGQVMVSSDNGATWKALPPLPSGTSFLGGGDHYSLAASDGYAYLSTSGDQTGDGNNYNQLHIFDVANNRWVVQTRILDLADTFQNNIGSRNGTGQYERNGQRFVKVFSIGGKPVVFFGGGQDVFMSTAQDPNTALLTWKRIARTSYSPGPVTDPNFMNKLHEDLWDLYALDPGGQIFIAGDGGVFRDAPDGRGWLNFNNGLHTHHVHALFAAPDGNAFAYPTTDNAAWWKGGTADWRHDDTGDSNWLMGDPLGAPPYAYLVRDRTFSTVVGFDQDVPDLDLKMGTWVSGVQRSVDQSLDGPLTMNVIWSATPRTAMDVVMLAPMPLQYYEGTTPTTVIDDPNQMRALVHNPIWLNHPDINQGKGAGWTLMADNLPVGTFGFVTGGGPNQLSVYALAGSDLYRWDGQQHGTWKRLDINPTQGSQLLVGSFDGPVFVNPYNGKELYVLTALGIRHSTDGGDLWVDEADLTALLTAKNAYPLSGAWTPNEAYVQVGQHGVGHGTMTSFSFDPSTAGRMVVASPFTGVFYNRGDGVWHDLASGLPKVHTPVAAAVLHGDNVYVGFEGRGLWGISGLTSIRPSVKSASNACGGTQTLRAIPGLWCEQNGQCGRWSCVSTDAVTCDLTHGARNQCGGCAPLPVVSGHARGDRCTCNNSALATGILVCAPQKNALICCSCNAAPGCGPGSP